jgi:hypothetical protein
MDKKEAVHRAQIVRIAEFLTAMKKADALQRGESFNYEFEGTKIRAALLTFGLGDYPGEGLMRYAEKVGERYYQGIDKGEYPDYENPHSGNIINPSDEDDHMATIGGGRKYLPPATSEELIAWANQPKNQEDRAGFNWVINRGIEGLQRTFGLIDAARDRVAGGGRGPIGR